MNDQKESRIQYEGHLNHLKEKIEINNKIQDSAWMLIQEMLVLKSAEKNTILLDRGNYEAAARFITKGILKVVYHDAKSYVYDFREKNDFLCDTFSLLGKTKSVYSFETVTDCEWIEISSEDLLFLSQKIHTVMGSFLKRNSEYAKRENERTAFLRIKNAEERYREFCQMRPEVIKYAKLIDIASFLDITPQSLSRIRKR